MDDKSKLAAPTLKDIARQANVHLSTVSLALRGSLKIAAATRERIASIAESAGYRPAPVNFALSQYRSKKAGKRSPMIAFVTNRAKPSEFESVPHMPSFLNGAFSQAREMGFRCELFLVGDKSLDLRKFENELREQNTKAVILAAFLPQRRQISLSWSQYALVKIDSWHMLPTVVRIGHDQEELARDAYRRMLSLGYRRIGLAIGRVDEESTSELYRSGYRLEQHLQSQEVLPPLLFGYDESETVSAQRLRRWIQVHRLDAVISNWGNIKTMLRKGGIRVPLQTACACLCLNKAQTDLAGLVVNHEMVGRKAAEIAAFLLKTGKLGIPEAAICLHVAGKWNDGASAPIRKRMREKSGSKKNRESFSRSLCRVTA